LVRAGRAEAVRRRRQGARGIDAELGIVRRAGPVLSRFRAAAGRACTARGRSRVSQGWDRWIGERGDALCVDRFGASAPGGEMLKQYGFTVDNVVARARALLNKIGR